MSEQDRFRHVEELFHELAELDTADRAARLEALRVTEPQVHAELDRLLRREDRGDGLAVARDAIDDALVDATEQLGQLGPYRLLRRLGQGGMGVVYEAEQLEPIQRRVAIKLTRFDRDNEHVLARFRAERQALALMNHPNVAQVHDAGATDDGRPYFVMELVEGEPLHHYCDDRELSVGARLELFMQVCAGVQHAHQKGIIHRDLKPTNILVTEQNGTPLPKIIDFGIAKAIGPDNLESGLTSLGAAIGTLEYMSPEQTLGTAIDTRTDVYALGVVLYELLTGDLPISRDALGEAGLAAAYRAIQEHEPQAPSRRLTPVTVQSSEAAARRSTAATTLARTLRQDLDWVVLKALAKEPERRYPTVSDLEADLERFSSHEPVSAGPPSARYRIVKFARRHRIGVAAAAAVLVSLVTAVVGTTTGLVRARQAEAKARHAEAEARVEATTAREVADFLVDLFQVSDSMNAPPGEERGRSITAEKILERGAARIRTELEDQPEVQGRLMTTIGRVYTNLGLYDEAEVQLQEALALRTDVLDADSAELAVGHRELGRLHRLRDQIDDAADQYRLAIEILERDPDTNFSALAEALNELGLLLVRTNPTGARDAYERARALVVGHHGPGHESLWRLDANIAAIDARSGRYEDARTSFEAALAGAERTLGPDHPRLGALLGNLAFVHRKLGNHRRARELQERDLALTETALGPDHPDLAGPLINLAVVCQRLGDYEAADRYGVRAIAIVDASLPSDHTYAALARSNHAVTLLRVGNFDRARELLESGIAAIATRRDREALVTTLRSRVLLAKVERWANKSQASLALADEVLADPLVQDLGTTVVDALFARAYVLAQSGEVAAAQDALEQALAQARDANGMRSEHLSYSEAVYWALRGDSETALARAEEAVETGYRDAALLSEPAFSSMRGDPRFQRIVQQIESTR